MRAREQGLPPQPAYRGPCIVCSERPGGSVTGMCTRCRSLRQKRRKKLCRAVQAITGQDLPMDYLATALRGSLGPAKAEQARAVVVQLLEALDAGRLIFHATQTHRRRPPSTRGRPEQREAVAL